MDLVAPLPLMGGANGSRRELRERVYLQTDKQFYLSGELVWMKFIATDLGPTVVRREQGGICGASG